MAPIDDKTLDRIKKCLMLSQSPEPHEAALALSRAQAMMQAAGVTAEEVEVGPIVEETLRSIASASKLKGWELRLYNAIADAFGCALLFQRGVKGSHVRALGLSDRLRYGRYIFLGPAADAKVALYAAQVLQRQLARARAAFTATLPDYYEKAEKTKHVDAYCTGWVVAVAEKVQPLIRSSAREKMLKIKVEETTKNAKHDLKLNDKSSQGSRAAMMLGFQEGKDAELHRPMNDGGVPKSHQLDGKKE